MNEYYRSMYEKFYEIKKYFFHAFHEDGVYYQRQHKTAKHLITTRIIAFIL